MKSASTRDWPNTIRFRKRSDFIAEEIKGWIVTHDMKPGDRLPQEKELMQIFGVSKGTTREALKALEVQGLVTIATGPTGGAALVEVPEEHAMQLLGHYFYFRPPTAKQIYEVRRILEPEAAAAAVGHLTDSHYGRLERLMADCGRRTQTAEERRQQRIAELEFHNVIADACPNQWLAFSCRFMNRLLSDLIVFRKIYLAPQQDFAHDNLRAHKALMKAFRRGEEAAVRSLMAEHMEEAAEHMINLNGVVERKFFLRRE
jgi:DNA-binding FadR family transcriptional regulator